LVSPIALIIAKFQLMRHSTQIGAEIQLSLSTISPANRHYGLFRPKELKSNLILEPPSHFSAYLTLSKFLPIRLAALIR